MLPPDNRLRRRPEFSAAVRGRRAGRGTVVVHLVASGPVVRAEPDAADVIPPAAPPPRVGLVVGRAVGPAVVRNQVKRRLRHLLRSRLDGLPPGALVVVRAAPSAAGASSAVLGDDVDAALARLLPRGKRPRNEGATRGDRQHSRQHVGDGRPTAPAGARRAR